MFSNSMSGQTMGRPEVLLLSDLHTLLLTAPKKGSKSRCNQNSSSKLDCTMCSSLAQRANQYMCKYQSFAGGLLRSPKVNVLKETLRRGHQVDVANWFNGKEFPEKWSQERYAEGIKQMLQNWFDGCARDVACGTPSPSPPPDDHPWKMPIMA
ncbi:TPA: hypothetical protein ACH3X3_007669 [Trebouxia sp. C0006]